MKFPGILKSWVDKEAKVIVSTGRCKLLEILFVATICYLACNCERNYGSIMVEVIITQFEMSMKLCLVILSILVPTPITYFKIGTVYARSKVNNTLLFSSFNRSLPNGK